MKPRASPLASMPASVAAVRELERLEATLSAAQEQRRSQAAAQQEMIRWVFIDPE